MTFESDDFERAGRLIRDYKECKTDHLSDAELDLIIKVQTQVEIFLRARGPKWDLASTPLVVEMETLWMSYRRAREAAKK